MNVKTGKFYFVCDMSETGLHIAVDGDMQTIPLENKDLVNKIVGLAETYNKEKDLKKREEIKKEVKDELTKFTSALSDTPFYMDAYGQVFHKDIPTIALSHHMGTMVKAFIEKGFSVSLLENFWKNVVLRDDPKVIQQLYSFLKNNGHPITPGGRFLAYKSVQLKYYLDDDNNIYRAENDIEQAKRKDIALRPIFEPFHTGGKYGNEIELNKAVRMPMEECDMDPNNTCSTGLHVGNMDYVRDFCRSSDRYVLLVLVNPRNVAAVPPDYSNTKMRVSEYFPIAVYSGEDNINQVFTESDYEEVDNKELEKIIAKKIKAKEEALKKQQEELEALKKVNGIV